MELEKIESGKRYERGMRYKLSFCNGDHAQYFTEMAFLELGREIEQLQNTSSNRDNALLDDLWEHIEKNLKNGSFIKSSIEEILKKHNNIKYLKSTK